MRISGKEDDKGMDSDVEGVHCLGGRVMLSSMRDKICACVVVVVVVALIVAVVVVPLVVAVGVVVLVMVVRVLRKLCIGVVEMVGELCIGVVEVDCMGVVDIMVLSGLFVLKVVEGVKLVVVCIVKVVLWFGNRKGYFLYCFSLKSVEMNGLSVGGCLFRMMICADSFLFLQLDFLGKMVGINLVMKMTVEVVVLEAVDVARAGLFAFSRRGCLGNMMDLTVGKVLMWLIVEELDGRINTGFPMGFQESSGKTSNTVSHSRSI